jgi:prepilin-type N-terminal cleavage/methylation domain-containing protein
MRRPVLDRLRNAAGFTILEMLTVVAIMLVLMAGIFAQLGKLQQVYKTEETKVDATEEARNLLDEIARELHQAGYPGDNMFAPNILVNPALNDQRVAAGLVRITPAQLWFEGDIDNDGVVDVVQYMLFDSNGNPVTAASTCPCTLQRSQVSPKAPNTAPLAQATNFTSGLRNVINSAGVTAGGALTIAGATNGTANDVLYAAYKTPSVFTALDQNGNTVVLPVDLTNPVALAAVKSVIVTVNTLSLSEDMAGRARIPFTVTMTAKINN